MPTWTSTKASKSKKRFHVRDSVAIACNRREMLHTLLSKEENSKKLLQQQEETMHESKNLETFQIEKTMNNEQVYSRHLITKGEERLERPTRKETRELQPLYVTPACNTSGGTMKRNKEL